MDDYKLVSGQAINYLKSGIFFSKNVSEGERDALRIILGVQNPLNTGHCLGLPSLMGRGKRHIFNYVNDRLWRKLNGWRGKKLSHTGKEMLIKSAAQAVPTFCMSTFLFPSMLLDELQRMMNSFWWGNNEDSSKGIKWMKWERVCVRKDAGGRGFCDLHLFNISLLWQIGLAAN